MNAELLAHAERNLADACADFQIEIAKAASPEEALVIRRRLERVGDVVNRLQTEALARATDLCDKQTPFEPDPNSECPECHAPYGELCHWACEYIERTR